MIPQRKLTLPMGNTREAVDSRTAMVQAAILSLLHGSDEGHTAIEMADAFGIPGDMVRGHLRILCGDGVIRRGPLQAYTQAILWQVAGGTEQDEVIQVRCSIAAAIKTPGVKRDPLVAALFGPAHGAFEVHA